MLCHGSDKQNYYVKENDDRMQTQKLETSGLLYAERCSNIRYMENESASSMKNPATKVAHMGVEYCANKGTRSPILTLMVADSTSLSPYGFKVRQRHPASPSRPKAGTSIQINGIKPRGSTHPVYYLQFELKSVKSTCETHSHGLVDDPWMKHKTSKRKQSN